MKTYFIFSFLFSIVITQSCNTGDRQIQQRCFNLVNQQLSWSEARNYCHNRNSYLATVPEQTTDSYLASYARTSFNINEGNFWIGLYRNSTTSKWQWDDGTPFAWNNFENPNLNYVAESIKNGKWNTFVAETRLNFVCSYYPNGAPTEPVTGSTEPPHWTTTESETVTPTESPLCLPSSPSTFFFAYSNDLPWETVQNTLYSLSMHEKYIKFASVRFDMQNPDPIFYAMSYGEMHNYVMNHYPDPSLAYTNPKTTSDILNILTQFLNNTQVPICGSQIFILLKRHRSNDAPSSFIHDTLQKNHIYVTALASLAPIVYGSSVYDLATMSKGICAFEMESNYAKVSAHIWNVVDVPYPFLVYYANARVQTNGTIALPYMNLPYTDKYYLLMTVQDHGSTTMANGTPDAFEWLKLEWKNVDTLVTGYVETTSADPTELNGTMYWPDSSLSFSSGSYDVKLSYTYKVPQSLEIRLYSVRPTYYWL